MLVGIPGAGKTTFATRLLEESSNQWVRVNQDEMGTRAVCEVEVDLPSMCDLRSVLGKKGISRWPRFGRGQVQLRSEAAEDLG